MYPTPSKDLMDAEITEPEPLAALKSCTDSAPGPDGIPYSVYKKIWDIVGSYIDRVRLNHQTLKTL